MRAKFAMTIALAFLGSMTGGGVAATDAQPAGAGDPSAGVPRDAKAIALEWLSRQTELAIYVPDANLTYRSYPPQGYTDMAGWDHRCNVGKIPTTYAVDGDARLVLEFRMGTGCPTFKYVFTGTTGEVYLRSKGAWEKRALKVELKGNRIEEERALAQQGR